MVSALLIIYYYAKKCSLKNKRLTYMFLIIIIAGLQQLLCDLDTVYLRFEFGFSPQLSDIWIWDLFATAYWIFDILIFGFSSQLSDIWILNLISVHNYLIFEFEICLPKIIGYLIFWYLEFSPQLSHIWIWDLLLWIQTLYLLLNSKIK